MMCKVMSLALTAVAAFSQPVALCASPIFGIQTLAIFQVPGNNVAIPFQRDRATQVTTEGTASPESQDDDNPFARTGTKPRPKSKNCGPDTAMARAGLKRPKLVEELCNGNFTELDEKWFFVVAYVKGFNGLLEERGSYLDPSGKCVLSAHPRHSLDLIYQAIDTIRGRGENFDEKADLSRMMQPFLDDWVRLPFILYELSAWQSEGKIDAMSVASKSLCGDPSYKLFWEHALDFSSRLPGTVK